MDRSRIDAHVRPLLGKRQIGSLKLGDIEGAQADIAAGKTSKARVGSRGGVTTGGEGRSRQDNVVATLHLRARRSPREDDRETLPGAFAGWRARRASADSAGSEIGKLGEALRKAEADGEHPKGIAAIRFLVADGLPSHGGTGPSEGLA